MLKTFSTNSIKYIRSVVKNLSNKIYMVEIKIKSQPQSIAQTPSIISPTKNELKTKQEIKSTYSSQAVSKNIPESTKEDADHYMFEDFYERGQSLEEENVTDKLSQLVQSLEIKCRSFERSPISAIISLNNVIKQLGELLLKHPELMNADLNHKMVALLLKIRQVSINLESKFNATNAQYSNQSKVLQENSLNVLARLGYVNTPKHKGVLILSIDGGGTRGILVIEILRQIELAYGKPIHQIFDLICGVSTGAIIAALLGALRISIDECEQHYRQVSSYLFKTDIITGTGRLLWSHAYYDTAVWEKILKEMYGSCTIMGDTKKNLSCPNLVAISAIVNLHSLQPYLFRNYELSPGSKPFSHFQGSSQHKLWEAVRASAAAPGYFEEFTLGDYVHQDGGILINNPTAVAVHEAKLLWPNEKIQCVLSLGSGRYQPDTIFEDKNKKNVQQSSLKHKIARLIDSATDTEMVHRLMQDLLPFNTYYRINPIIRDRANIDENRPEKLENMKVDAQMYLRKNSHKFSQLINNLKKERSYTQQFIDLVKLRMRV